MMRADFGPRSALLLLLLGLLLAAFVFAPAAAALGEKNGNAAAPGPPAPRGNYTGEVAEYVVMTVAVEDASHANFTGGVYGWKDLTPCFQVEYDWDDKTGAVALPWTRGARPVGCLVDYFQFFFPNLPKGRSFDVGQVRLGYNGFQDALVVNYPGQAPLVLHGGRSAPPTAAASKAAGQRRAAEPGENGPVLV